ncbi:MAG: arylesterase [Burkholderiales bacterium RIFCSPLOWO2_02_FULL_57_36]|nr:MAG: arylesterase [Burkholderiales bacterium RIFCSPLOWO2_02_FULL_57_36]
MLIKPGNVFFVLLFSFLLAACKEAPRYQPAPAGTVVLAFGDSVTHGTGAGSSEDYPTRLAQRSGWKVVNAGIPGDTAAAATSRIDALLRETNPAMVIVELGGNDFLRRRGESEVKEDLRTILRAVKKSGATPVLVAVPQFSITLVGGLSDAVIYADLAKEESVLLVEDVFSDVLSDASLRADRIHPNAEGYRKLADGIAKALDKAGLLAVH